MFDDVWPVVYQRSEVLTGLHIYEEDRHHQVETGSAEADSVDSGVSDQHLAVTSAVRLVTHHVKERHLQHTHTHTQHIGDMNIADSIW